ncbi:MAG: phosphonate ABC transporter, permease protein PhnE [Corynebacterium casei]|uniref:phosphonate ABC transporter, permease protein PhnE n=1 Tax=Corynebacterium casei TaxID=160386 RepID=UPI00264926DE|nr:phosphonate ABC transporter, permease protein PhnE [Corynebacterium casei]MDN5799950.1 phosphonate ABC transporter, permease protein PhnE [Corynebacterium casei]MDN5922709.1 phosphonate ABC transporter, permease protein PhnE [Corynebacterium casei]MDN6132372.1 phosphonate ABC transporter, permease protein PhnE [Corynebacterium casei]MDN6246202.1 phosphonate ABC transporter, permease protein PhnE [Corynebacterium casei]MDN6263991.1 phosphonate ABC transporter, permease protein PhnE [Coryneba
MTSKTSAAPTSKPESAKTGQTKMWLAVAGVVVMTVLSASPGLGGVEIDLRSLIRNWSNGYNKLLQMLHPNFEFIPRTIGPMLEALQMAWVGAAISAIISVPLTLWAARVTNQSGVGRFLVRTIINVVRAVPDLVYATVLVAMVGVGALPGVMTLILFNIGIVVKLVSESIDSGDHDYMEAGRAAGGTQFQINRSMTMPQVLPLFMNQWLYTLELNVRISAILGIVGAGGIGRLLDERRSFYAYSDVSVIILEILIVVIAIELLSNYLRRRWTS